jgi:hypothetical protein
VLAQQSCCGQYLVATHRLGYGLEGESLLPFSQCNTTGCSKPANVTPVLVLPALLLADRGYRIGHDHFGKLGHRFLGSLPRFLRLIVMAPFVSQLPDLSFSMPTRKDSMAVLKEFLEAGNITSVIDRTYPLSEIPETIRYLEEGHTQGKVVITV